MCERLFHVTVSAWRKNDKERECCVLFFCVNIYHTGKKKERKQQISIIRYEPIVFQAGENKIHCEATTNETWKTNMRCDQSVSSSESPEILRQIRSPKQRGFVLFSGSSASASKTRDRPRGGDGGGDGKKTLITRVNRLGGMTSMQKLSRSQSLPTGGGGASSKQTNKKNTNSRFTTGVNVLFAISSPRRSRQ